MDVIPQNHFLALPRPDVAAGVSEGVPDGAVDTSTLAAHDFDVDPRTGFMPPAVPLARLPAQWEAWEAALQDAIDRGLQLGEKLDLEERDRCESAAWRARVQKLPVLPTAELKNSEILLRRAHKVLAWIMHFYIHSLPPSDPILIPKPIGVPLLQVSQHLALPPILTYSDDVLYNWEYREVSTPEPAPTSPDSPLPDSPFATLTPPVMVPTPDNIRSQTLFTGTSDEEEFYLASARIELVGVNALSLMEHTLDEAFVGDALALRRIAIALADLAGVVDAMAERLRAVRDGCDPELFYRDIRPWFRGQDSTPGGRRWVFEGVEEAGLTQPTELSGPSAGQSSIIHALDIFLGVDNHSPLPATTQPTGSAPSASSSSMGMGCGSSTATGPAPPERPSFLARMQLYMPRHHRVFLRHLSTHAPPLRALVAQNTADGTNPELRAGFNAAVRALRGFRDAHLRIVALYIVGPARRVNAGMRAAGCCGGLAKTDMHKGTGGTDLVPFLKGVRDQTARTELRD